MALEVQPISGVLGAEVSGITLAEMDDGTVAEIDTALRDHQVLVFRDQPLSPDQQLALAQRFANGAIYVHSREDRLLLKQAKRLGFVSDEGYLTSDGTAFQESYPSRSPATGRRPGEPFPPYCRAPCWQS